MSDHILALMTIQVWQITALVIVVAVVVKLTAKNRPHLAHALWVLVLIKCVTPPLWGHSLGVFSQLQARFMPDESASLTEVSDSPASVPVAIAEALVSAPEIDGPNPQHGQPETFEPDELLSIADTEPPEDASPMSDGSMGFELDEAAQTLDKQEAHITYAEPTVPVERFLLSGLVAGAILTVFVMVIRCLRCVRAIHRHRTTEFDEQLCERVQQLSRQLRIRRIPRIIVSDVLFGPAVLGLLRHTIVLPRCLFETAAGSQSRSFLPERTFAGRRTALGPTSAQRQNAAVEATSSGRVAASREVLPGRDDLPKLLPGRRDLVFLDPILAHELLHIRRGDLRTGTLQAIAQSLWWFHPAVWLSNRWLSREAERCCDEQVIAELGCTPSQYARSLLSVIECKHRLQPIPVFPGMKPVEITTQRMERIMSLKNGLMKRTPIWCWLMIVALALVVLPGAANQPAADEAKPAVLLKMEDRVNNPMMTRIRLDDNFVLSQDVPVTGSTVIAYVNRKPITVESLLAESSTALLLKHLPEMTDSDRRRIVTRAIKNSLPTYVYEEVVLQHFYANLSAEQQAQLAAAQEKRDAELLAMLPGMLEQSKKLESQEDLLATAFYSYKMRDQAANGDLSRLCRDALVARYIAEATETDDDCERDATLLHCRDLLLQAQLRTDVSLSFSNASLMDVLRSIAIDVGINIAVRARVVEKPATVTFHCENAPLDDALATIVEPFGLCVRLHKDVVMIESADSKQTLSKGATTDSGTTTNAPSKVEFEEEGNEKHEPFAAAKETIAVAERLVLCCYPVADLVVCPNPVVATASRTGDRDNRANQAVIPVVALAFALEKSVDQAAPKSISRPKDGNDIRMATNSSVDFAPLTELIKATVKPESWASEGNGLIAVDEKLLSLVIKQTQSAHGEIADLLSQLRNDQDANVRIQCRIFQLNKDSQMTWLDGQCSLHPLKAGSRWALLPQQRSESFAQALLEQQPEVLSVPTVMTISGQTATITVGESALDETAPTGIRMKMTPHLFLESKVIRMQHSFSIGEFANEMPQPVESLVGSGQTLLLLIDDPEDKEKPDAARSQYLLMVTPEHIPQKEEEEAVSAATPEDSSTDAVDRADSPDK